MSKRQYTALSIILFIVFCIGYGMAFSYNVTESTIGGILMIISLSSVVVFGVINAIIEFTKKKRQNKKED